jgi:hypothetical protein
MMAAAIFYDGQDSPYDGVVRLLVRIGAGDAHGYQATNRQSHRQPGGHDGSPSAKLPEIACGCLQMPFCHRSHNGEEREMKSA